MSATKVDLESEIQVQRTLVRDRERKRDEARGRVDHLVAVTTNSITDLEKLATQVEAAVANNEDATQCAHVVLKRIAPIPAKAATENFAALVSVALSLRQQAKTLRDHLERHEPEASRS